MDLVELKGELMEVAELTGIPCEEFGIGAGGAMLFYGLRDKTNDVDVTLPHELFETLYGKYEVHIFKSFVDGLPHEKISIGNVDIHNEVDSSDYLHPKYVMFGSFKVECLHSILSHKKLMNRIKDQEDIKKLTKACVKIKRAS